MRNQHAKAALLTIAVLLIAGTLAMCGCGTTAVQRVDAAQVAYNLAVTEATKLRAAGKISDKQALQIEVARRTVAAALRSAEAQIAAGQEPDNLSALSAALTEFLAAEVQPVVPATAPATQPG